MHIYRINEQNKSVKVYICFETIKTPLLQYNSRLAGQKNTKMKLKFTTQKKKKKVKKELFVGHKKTEYFYKGSNSSNIINVKILFLRYFHKSFKSKQLK